MRLSLSTAAAVLLLFACQDIVGQAWLTVGASAEDGAGGTSGAGDPVGGNQAGSPGSLGGSFPVTGAQPECQLCRSDRDCAGEGARCTRFDQSLLGICGFSCRTGCAPTHACVLLTREATPQCVPVGATCENLKPFSALASQTELRSFLLELLNARRQEQGLEPLVLDECLNHEAQAATLEWVRSGERHRYFEQTCSRQRPCACGWAEESQLVVRQENATWQTQLRSAVDDELEQRPLGSLAMSLSSTQYARVGLGLVMAEDRAWITAAFASGAQIPR